MGKLDFTVSLDDDDIPDRIRRSLKGGIRDAADELLDSGQKTAKNTIQKRGRVWRRELMNSFEEENKGTGGGRRAVLRNVATHAAPVEHGATYGTRGPPIAALIPWVLSKWRPSSGSDNFDGGSGQVSKDSTTRSKKFSENRKLRSSSETTNYNRISDEIWEELDVQRYDDGRLKRLSAESLEIKLKQHPELSHDDTNRIIGDIKEWKQTSDPRSERVARYAEVSRVAFGIDGNARGNHPDPVTKGEIDAIRTISELSRTNLQESVFDGEDSGTLYRGLTRETGRLTREMLDNPSADRWVIDVNAIDNYSTRKSNTKIFDRGLLVEHEVDLEDVTNTPDFLFTTRNRSELELHIKGGNNKVFRRDDLQFIIKNVDWHGQGAGRFYMPMDDILTSIESGGFDRLGDEELRAFNRLINQMDKYGVAVNTPGGQNRLLDFRDTMISRNLWGRYTNTQQDFIDRIDDLI